MAVVRRVDYVCRVTRYRVNFATTTNKAKFSST